MAARRPLRAGLALCAGLAIAGLAPCAPAVTEFPLPSQRTPGDIAAGPDNALWLTTSGSAGSRIGRMTTGGTVVEFAVPASMRSPFGITRGPDGALWFADRLSPRIARITTDGAVRVFDVPAPGTQIGGLAAGPQGALWFTLGTRIGRLTTTGTFTLFALPAGAVAQGGITAGPDGALWFTESETDRIGRITTVGTVTRFPVPTSGSRPQDIVAGSDGALWFTASAAGRIGRVTTTGSVTEFPVRTPASAPSAIAGGSDGALWFVESGSGKIGRITTTGTITDFRVSGFPGDIAAGPDGALWFTVPATGRVGRMPTDHPPEDAVDGILFTRPPCDRSQPGCSSQPRYLFRAASGAAGQVPRGSVLHEVGERQGTTTVAGKVTCLRVEGRRAAMGVEFPDSQPSPPVLPARAAVVVVEDNGQASADRFSVRELPAGSAPSACPSPAGVALDPGFPGSPGASDPGVVVTDAQSPSAR